MMNDKKHKSITEVAIDIIIDRMTKDVQEVLDLLPKCEGDDDE